LIPVLKTDEYLRQAAYGFQIAEAYLTEAEEQLHELVERLENSAELIKGIPKDELLLWEQVDTIIQENQLHGDGELEPVGS
jgi:hypothetical protein